MKRKRIGGKLRKTDKGYPRAKQNEAYLVREGIDITMKDLLQAVGGCE